MHFIEPLAEKKNITVSFTMDPEVIYCWGDELRLKQILVNMLGNAVKFTPEGLSIGLIVTREPSTEAVVFEIWDTGIGIDPKKMKQIFKPFIQLDSKLSRLYGGSGLGLTLAHRLVKLHSGSITLSSNKSGGCSFFVRIPTNKPVSSVCLIQKCDWKGIVYTEGEAFLELLHELVKDPHAPELIFIKQPFDPDTCKLPYDADFILMDISVLNQDSMEMVEKIKSITKQTTVPVLFILSLDLPDNVTYINKIPNSSYLLHPFPLTFLLKRISSIVVKKVNEEQK
jgi:CheY-like chemotaxis protein